MEFGFLETVKLLGSLGFFIYGMKIMSEAIQKVAGSKLRDFLSNMTSNRAKGVTTGFLITSLVQSSSATTVLVVSFVNAGLLSLLEAIGVIMGANIGTTMTAWLLSSVGFKVSVTKFALPIIAFAFPMIFFSKDKIKSWGEVLIGFALLLMGLQFLKDSVPDLEGNSEMLAFLSNYTDLGILSTLLFVLIGTVITVVVQSSSAAMALTLVMANNGWIPFEIAAALVLGENIGTTITANIAALVGNVHAKRAAFAHFIFNIFGVLWIIILLKPFLGAVDSIMVWFGNASAYEDSEAIKFTLSAFHTSFNILNTLLLVWFAGKIASLVTRIVKSKGDDDEFRLEFISTGLMSTSELSIEEARKETARYGDITARMSGFVHKLLQASKTKKQTKLLAKIRKYEEITDRIEEEISDYVQKVSSAGNLSAASAQRVASIFSIINDLERIGDLFFQLSKDIDRKIESGLNFSDDQISNIDKMLVLLDEALTIMNENLNSKYEDVSIDSAVLKENEINEMRNKLRKEHLKNIENGAYDVRIGTLYKDIFHACEKIGDHIINVSRSNYRRERKRSKIRYYS